MSRIVKAPDVRRQELIEIALKQFIENGYEKTSVRSILQEAGGEIGMFYHYFKSKNEIYEAALENYNEKYISKFTEITIFPNLSFEQKLNQIFTLLADSLSEYHQIDSEKKNPEIKTLLHSRTLLKIAPLFEQLIVDGVQNNILNTPIPNLHLLSQFILFGISAVIHDNEVKLMEDKIKHIKALLSKLLDIKLD